MFTNLLVFFFITSLNSSCEEKYIGRLLDRSETVIMVRVIDVAPPSLPVWTSAITTTQSVKYKVEKVLKGGIQESEVMVLHRLIPNSRTANKDKSKPQLSLKFLKKGRLLLLILDKEDWPVKSEKGTEFKASYVVTDETCGVFPARSASARSIEKILREK